MADYIELNAFMRECLAQQRQRGEIESVSYATVDEYAERIRRKPATVRLMCSRGEIEGAVKDGKSWLIPIKDSAETMNLKDENIRLHKENAALREKIDCIKAILKIQLVGDQNEKI